MAAQNSPAAAAEDESQSASAAAAAAAAAVEAGDGGGGSGGGDGSGTAPAVMSFSEFAAARLQPTPPPSIGDDTVFAAGPKLLTPSALGTAPPYPATTTPGFLLTPDANEYQAVPTGLLKDLPANTLADQPPRSVTAAPSSSSSPQQRQPRPASPKTTKADLADELGDDGLLDLSSSSSD
eukprot:COSAG06_NODE_29111_length_562_cov_1.187905_1_plen_179_part_10